MSCSEVYPIPIPHFSSSLLSSPCWHHQLLTLRETCPNHCSSTQSQLFHLSYSSPAPSSLHCTIPPWVSQQPPTLLPTHFVCPQRHVSLPPPFLSSFSSSDYCVACLLLCLQPSVTQVTPAPPGTFSPSSVDCLLVLP